MTLNPPSGLRIETDLGWSPTPPPQFKGKFIGPFPVAVIEWDWSDTNTTFDLPRLQAQLETVRQYFDEVSYGKLSISFTYFGPVRVSIPFNTSWSVLNPIAQEILNILHLTITDFKVFAFMGGPDDFGRALGGQYTWINGKRYVCADPIEGGHTIAHELFHMSGSSHSMGMDAGMVPFVPPSQNPQFKLTSDIFDILIGTPGLQPPHVYHRWNAGWLDPNSFLTIAKPGTYSFRISPLNQASGIHGIRIPRGTTDTSFQIECRKAVGFDRILFQPFPNQNITNGALITFHHYYADCDVFLLNMHPPVVIPNVTSALLVGESFVDPEYGISIKTIGVDANGVDIEVICP